MLSLSLKIMLSLWCAIWAALAVVVAFVVVPVFSGDDSLTLFADFGVLCCVIMIAMPLIALAMRHDRERKS